MLYMQLFLLDLLSNFIFTPVDCALEIITKKRKEKKKGSHDKVSLFKAHYSWHCPFWHIIMH